MSTVLPPRPAPDWPGMQPATVEDYNTIGREVTDEEVAAVEGAASNWSPPED